MAFQHQPRHLIRATMLIATLGGLLVSLGVVISRLAGDSRSPDVSSRTTLSLADVIRHTGLSQHAIVNSVPGGIRGQGLGFVRPSDLNVPPLERPQTEEFRLASGQPFAPFLILINPDAQPITFLITGLLDYQQLPFQLDGQTALLHEVVVSPGTELNLPLELSITGSGAHDLLFVAFLGPHSHSEDIESRAAELGHITGRRAVVVVGDWEQPYQSLAAPIGGKEPPPNLASVPIRVGFAAAPTKASEHPSERPIYFVQARPGQVFTFQTWVTNFALDTPVEYALVGFLNYHQIDLSVPKATVVQLDVGEEAILSVSIRVPDLAAVHELQVVYIFDPHKSILREQVLAPFVFSSPRLGIDAR